MNQSTKRHRILIGKPGLDGHDRGAKYVAHVLRDAGFEVIYTGLRRQAEEIVATAIQEDVDAIGLSILSGAHLAVFERVIALLEEQGAQDIVLFAGGIIPPDDVEALKAMGVAEVFTPGTTDAAIIDAIRKQLATRADAT